MLRGMVLFLAAAVFGAAAWGLQSERQLRTRPAPADGPPQAVPRGYALVVGIGTYQQLRPSENLQFGESDAEAVYRVLISQEGGAFPAENVHLLLGSNATLEKLSYELEEWLPSVAQEQDRVVVYFTGHGLVRRGRGYLAPWDINPADPENTAYAMEQLGQVLSEKVKARWKVLMADACHSGKITPETTDEAVVNQLRQLPQSFLTLTATRGRESSFEDPDLSTGLGLFSYFVVQGLQGNADNDPCDGLITADETIEYVRGGVRSYGRSRGVSQTPTEHGDFDNDMILGQSARCTGSAPSSSEAWSSRPTWTALTCM